MFLKRLITKYRVAKLKRKAKQYYRAYVTDGHGGRHIANIISGGRIDHHATMFNQTMDDLAELDSNTPSTRLPVSLGV